VITDPFLNVLTGNRPRSKKTDLQTGVDAPPLFEDHLIFLTAHLWVPVGDPKLTDWAPFGGPLATRINIDVEASLFREPFDRETSPEKILLKKILLEKTLLEKFFLEKILFGKMNLGRAHRGQTLLRSRFLRSLFL
jgi:hypothetical protein